ncbi:MAG TPA: hypothetical protein VGI14_03290 [Casimicrobiaceae bacterium]
MILARLSLAMLAASAVLALSACGERPQVVSYKQGTYQGKPDTPPYDAQYKGNRQEWENAISTRIKAQNEYKRVR